jgi:outer membrane immunogenic protein
MRRLFAGSLGLLAIVSPAMAADIPAAPAKAPAYYAPGYNWYGFFIGAHAGYLWGGSGGTNIAGAPPPLPAGIVTAINTEPDGFIGGIHWGTNWQSGRWVYGFDSDISFSDIKGSQTVVSGAVTNFGEQSLSWFGTTRVRAGYTIQDNLLIYATGGLASGRAEITLRHTPGFTGLSGHETLWGWALGAGIEYGMGPWSLRLDYLHYDLGDVSFRYALGGGAFALATTNVSGDIVRGGVSYRFNWTPWELIFGRR